MTTAPPVYTREELEVAVAVANVPALLMVVFQMTGDERWLQEPYLPTKGVGLGDHDSGGLPEAIQAEIRAAAVPAILDLQAGGTPAVSTPSPALTSRMLSVCLGEPVGVEYGAMLSAEIRRRAGSAEPQPEFPVAEAPRGYKVLVIGTGVAGIAAAHELEDMGVEYTIVDRQARPGGNWWQNTYPGAGVDTPSHLYSFSFAKHTWSRHFALRNELQEYLAATLDQLGAARRVRYETDVLRAVWDGKRRIWTVTVTNPDGTEETLEANVVISAVGVLNRPHLPAVEGIERFAGTSFHSAEWPPGLDLRCKRVAIVGTGASSMQISPAIAGNVEHLTIFQRSPQWVAPFEKFGVPIPPELQHLLQACSLYHAWYWVRLFWQFGDRVIEALRADPSWPHPERSMNSRNDAHRRYFTTYLEDRLEGRPDLIEKAMPDYPPFGKRILLDNGWFDTLKRPNVTLVADAVAEVREHSVVTDLGEEHEVDVLIWATGFQAARFLSSLEVRGVDGTVLSDQWHDDDPRAYLGMSIPRFPNFFMLGGPHSFPGSGSYMYFMEVQMRYLRSLMTKMIDSDIGSLDPLDEVNDRYNELVDRLHETMVWTHPGMQTYYRNSRGRVVFVMPFLNVDYWEMTRQVKLEEYTSR